MLATSGPVPEGDSWAFEIKWDGARAIAAVGGDQLRVQSRNAKPIVDTYPGWASCAGSATDRWCSTGEVVALDVNGVPDFGPLQARMQATR